MPVYPPTDDVVGPIASQLVSIGQTQLSGIDQFYTYETDQAPVHNSLMVMEPKFEVMDDTNGRLILMLKFPLCLRRNTSQMDQDYISLRSYVTPMLNVYGAWANNELGGLARITSVKGGAIVKEIYAGELFRTLVLNLDVEVEYNIPTS